jgi:hypothetical protein
MHFVCQPTSEEFHAFFYRHVVPWDVAIQEYERMFALITPTLQKLILGCGDGPAAFNSEAAKRGLEVLSLRPDFTSFPQWKSRGASTQPPSKYFRAYATIWTISCGKQALAGRIRPKPYITPDMQSMRAPFSTDFKRIA